MWSGEERKWTTLAKVGVKIENDKCSWGKKTPLKGQGLYLIDLPISCVDGSETVTNICWMTKGQVALLSSSVPARPLVYAHNILLSISSTTIAPVDCPIRKKGGKEERCWERRNQGLRMVREHMDQVKQHTSLHLIPGALALMAMWSSSKKPWYILEFEKGY